MNDSDERPSHTYIGRDPKCGCMRAAIVDYRDAATGKYVARFIAQGLTVERVTTAVVRTLSFVCPHRGEGVTQERLDV